MRTKLDSGIFKRFHSLIRPPPTADLPVFIQDNPSGAFHYPFTTEEISVILGTIPEEHQYLTHIWLAKVKKHSYLLGEIPQGHFICGSKVYLIKLNAISKDMRLYFGRKRPESRVLPFYKERSSDLRKDGNGY